MKQLNSSISRAHRAISVARAVFLITIVAGVACFAARGVYTSRASRIVAITTAPTAAPSSVEPAPSSAAANVLSAITVNTTSDVTNGTDGLCTLREAITAANDDTESGVTPGECAAGSGDDTISFTVTGTITLLTSLPQLQSTMSINGPGSNLLTIARSSDGGTPQFRVFYANAVVDISGVTVTNGATSVSDPYGGGILNAGSSLTLTDVIVSGNTTSEGSPGGGVGGAGGNGGGIYNAAGTLTMTSCVVSGNTAGQGGAASGWGGPGGSGGGIHNDATLIMIDCSVTGNNAGQGGSGVAGGGNGGPGGGIYNQYGEFANVNMTNCTVSGNNAGSSGDGGGNGAHGGGIATFGGITTLTGVTLTNNSAGDAATANVGGNGGGIYIGGQAGVTLINSTVSGNQSGSSTSGLPGWGGGISNHVALTVTGSTINNNTTESVGGGIANREASAVMLITNSTVSGNQASGSGAGIYNDAAVMRMTNCTVTNHTSIGFSTSGAHTRTVRNSIIAGNGTDLEGSFTSQGNNLIGKSDGTNGFTSGSNGDQVGTLATPLDPRLGLLATNGGPTQTHALLAESTAIDAGNNCVFNNSCSPALGVSLTTDQRGAGFNRSIDGNGDGTATVDIGAYEVQSILVTNTADSGAGSLRQAITDANANPATNTIIFQAGLTGTITLLSALPDLSTSMSINGPGANQMIVQRSTAGGTPDFRIFTIKSGHIISISGLTISNGRGGSTGGGILNELSTLNLSNCTITGNSAIHGGGIYNNLGTLNVDNTTFAGNTTTTGSGGGISNDNILNVTNSTFSGNSGGTSGGGAIMNLGTATVTNCTLTGNSAGEGGGVFNYPSATTNIRNSVIALNSSSSTCGGNCPNGSQNLSGTFSTQGHNLVGNADGSSGFINGSNGDQVGSTVSPINPLLGPLGNNGGPTQTHALLPSSPALNAGSNALATSAGLTTDQRGFARITNTTVDIGSFESRGFTIAATSGTPQSAQITTAFGSPLVATVSSAFGEPVAGGAVIFTAPSSGASGTFPGSVTTANVSINASGLATAPTFTANGTFGGPYNVVASLAGGSPSANFSLTNLKANQTITFNALANKTFGDADFNVSATASSGLAVSFTASGQCTVSGTLVHITGAGTCTITAKQAGNTTYNAAPDVPRAFTIAKANQTITFNALANKTFGDADFNVSATASSGLAVSFTASGQCTISGTLVHITAAGTCTITAKQAGNTNYNAAPDVPRAFTIAKANQTITFNALMNKTFGDADFNVSATASSGLAVSFTASGQCTISGTLVHITAAGTCTITAKQAGNTNYNAAPDVPRAFTIAKANQTITFNALLNKTFGNADFNVSATASSGLAVSFTASGQCTISGTLVHITAPGSCTITAKQAGNTNYNAAPDVPRAFTIAKAATTTAVSSSVNPSEFGQSVTFTATVTSSAGTPTGTVQFKDGAANIGSLQTLTAGVAQVTTSSLSPGSHTITADYSGDANFLISTGSLSGGQTVTSQRTLSINDVSVTEGNSGTANLTFTVTLSAASSLTVTVKYDTAEGSATIADGDYQLNPGTLTFNPGDLTKTVTVLVNGDHKTEPDETVFVVLSNPVNAAFSDSQATGTILNDDTLQLLLDTSGPDANQLAALDSLLLTRDPFRVQNPASWFTSDQNTRVILFALNLQLGSGESSSVVKVILVDGNGQPQEVAAEDVRSIADTAFTQVTFRLPDGLAPGTCLVTIKAHERTSNTGTFRIAP